MTMKYAAPDTRLINYTHGLAVQSLPARLTPVSE